MFFLAVLVYLASQGVSQCLIALKQWKLHIFELEEEMKIDPSIKYVIYQVCIIQCYDRLVSQLSACKIPARSIWKLRERELYPLLCSLCSQGTCICNFLAPCCVLHTVYKFWKA